MRHGAFEGVPSRASKRLRLLMQLPRLERASKSLSGTRRWSQHLGLGLRHAHVKSRAGPMLIRCRRASMSCGLGGVYEPCPALRELPTSAG